VTAATATDYAAFVSGIGFEFIQPETPLEPASYELLKVALGAYGACVDAVNTRLGPDEALIKERLRDLLPIPRMSTLAVAAILNRAVGEMDPAHAFVNVGVWQGFTLLAGMAGNPDKICIGVDDFSQFGGPRAEFYERFRQRRSPRHRFFDMDYREYFACMHEEPIGVYLYDGDHGYEDQRLGLELAEPFFADGCIVVVDDTNCEEPRQATLDFVARSRAAWEILLDRRTSANGHPTFWNGLMVLRRGRSRS